MPHRRRISVSPLLISLSLLLLAGCSRDLPNSPASLGASFLTDRAALSAPGTKAFFPLDLGNRWHATAESHIVTQPTGGAPEELIIRGDISRELTGTETFLGRTYTVQTETLVETGEGVNLVPLTSFTRYRQDATGLYEFQGDPSAPAATSLTAQAASSGGVASRASSRPLPASLRARLPVDQVASYERAWALLQDRAAKIRQGVAAFGNRAEGPLSDEATRLDYPLHPGAEWSILTTPVFTSTVEGVDNLNLDAGRFQAYRIRIDNEFLQDGDTVHLWMGRAGQLQFEYHLVADATDENGNVIGTVTFDYHEAVNEVALVKP